MDAALRNLVRERAAERCEYCGVHQDDEPFYRFHIEHVIAKQHGGRDEASNLALSCHHCNLQKGPNLSAIDPDTAQIVALFHPRQQAWAEHFQMQGVTVVGLTATGRATVRLLQMNAVTRIELRAAAAGRSGA